MGQENPIRDKEIKGGDSVSRVVPVILRICGLAKRE